FVAHADIGAKACVTIVITLCEQRQRNVSRLRQYAQGAWIYVRPAHEIAACMTVKHAVGVRADQAYTATPRAREDLGFKDAAGLASLAEAAGKDQRCLDPLCPA